MQRLQCNKCHNCGDDVWTGTWPGDEDAIRLGWYSYWDDAKGWVRCGPDHPGAGPDLNRLHWEGEWNRKLQRWEARDVREETSSVR